MGQGLLVGGSGGLPPLNSETVELPAYDADIKPNTFVSIADYQNGFATSALEDSTITQGRIYSLDTTHFLLVITDSTSTEQLFQVIKINTNGRCTIVASETVNTVEPQNGYFIVRASNNRFFVYCRGEYLNNSKAISAGRITLKINTDYSIEFLSTSTRSESISPNSSSGKLTEGITYISELGNDLFLVSGTTVSVSYTSPSWPTYNSVYATKVCELDESGNLVELYEVERSSTSNRTTYYVAGITTTGRPVIVRHNDNAASNPYYIDLYTATDSALTNITQSDESIAGEELITHMVALGNNAYMIFAESSSISLLTITDNSIRFIKSTTSIPNSHAYESGMVYDTERQCVYAVANGAAIYKIDPTTLESIALQGSSKICIGMIRYAENIYYGGMWRTGIGRFDLTTLQKCVRDSLDTSVISGLTLTACTKKKAGKVCVLSGSTATMTSYGLQQNVVNTVIDDSIDAIQEEVQNAMDK